MIKGVIRIRVDTEDVFCELTQEMGEVIFVSRAEMHADGVISFVIDLPKTIPNVVSRLEADSLVEEVRPITESKFLIRKKSAGAIPIILQNGGMLHGTDTVYEKDRVFNVLVFHRSHLRNIVAELEDARGNVNMMKITTTADEGPLLSSRQEEVVQTALQNGYFDWPRKIDSSDLAEILDVSHPTMLEHLRKGEKKLLQWIFHKTDYETFDHNTATRPQIEGSSVSADGG